MVKLDHIQSPLAGPALTHKRLWFVESFGDLYLRQARFEAQFPKERAQPLVLRRVD
ncbi:hypothetical protein HDA45_003050 [Amycolatopsis umgeniensis]|uniref:Uncharacterized protein n=1 Tax=Amycolatopsis umgeniensis TaxID=336628 RepID=A0A841B1N4_9PSEU|nr:hypothetical protein [Amycolatopsis umgeniensis]